MRCREVVPAQIRTRHVPLSAFSSCPVAVDGGVEWGSLPLPRPQAINATIRNGTTMTESVTQSEQRAGAPKAVSKRRMTPLRRLAYTLTAPVLVGLIRFMWWTYRFEIRGDEGLRDLAAQSKPMVLAFWHGDLFMMPWYLSRLTECGVGVTYLVSPSMDGEYAVKLLNVIGGRTVRGSATRSGTKAIRGLYRVIVKDKGSPVVAADGPKGPYHRCKKGAVVLGQLTEAKIVPMAAAPKRAFHLRTWDRLPVPLPFSRIAVEVGEPVEIPKDLTEDEVEIHRQRLEAEINDLGRRAVERATG
jgi:lysophospholipid acyltransferase (LPLAT)-like uncharacterized protein